MALKLAKRTLAVPQLVHWLIILSFLTLDVAKDITNANRYAVNFQCAIEPDLRAMIVSGASIGHLNFLDCTAVPIDDAPTRTQNVAHANGGRPTLILYFSTPEDFTGGNGLLTVAYPLSQNIMDYMASAPTETIRTVLLGDTVIPLIKDNIEGVLE